MSSDDIISHKITKKSFNVTDFIIFSILATLNDFFLIYHSNSIVPGGLLVRSYFNMSGPRIAAKVLNMEAAINIGINGIRQAARTSKSIDT